MLNLEDIGTIFKWDQFPDPRYGSEIKPRWFIYLGKVGGFSGLVQIYLSTTTTQMRHFEPGGSRFRHSHFKFEKRQFPCFEEDCIIDFDEPPRCINFNKVLDHEKNIEIKGKLDENTLRMIYNKLLKSSKYSKRILLDIHNSLNQADITGLKKPK